MPSIPKQLADVTKALATSLRHLARTGHLAATADEIDHRISVCEACEMFTGSRCRSCGCYVHAKAALAAQSCPLKKW